MSEFWATLEIVFLPPDEGGRQHPLNFSKKNAGSYRPHLRILGGNGEMLGIAVMDGPDEDVQPGVRTNVTAKGVYAPLVSYRDLVKGVQFEILEGPNVVGKGRVIGP